MLRVIPLSLPHNMLINLSTFRRALVQHYKEKILRKFVSCGLMKTSGKTRVYVSPGKLSPRAVKKFADFRAPKSPYASEHLADFKPKSEIFLSHYSRF